MPCTLSTEKRAHLAHRAAPAAATADWSTVFPKDATIKLAEHIVADNDIDSYMAFRAVCHNWRTETTDQPGKVDDHTDPTRFQPTKWALLDKQDDRVTFVDVDAGRFLRMSIPILHNNYLFIGATSGGLILLGEMEEPHRASLLNPFTAAIAQFKVSAPVEGVMTVAVTTKPLMVFVSLEDGDIIWADQSSERFKRYCRMEFNKTTPIVAFDGDVYASDLHGAIFTSVIDDVPDGEKCRSAATIFMLVTIPRHNSNNASPDASPEAMAGIGGRYYLVQSGGDLLLVTRPLNGAPPDADQPLVRRVDTERNVLETVDSIGNRAISVSHVRCISVNADKFQGIKGGCIYFVEPPIVAQDNYVPSTITTYQVAAGPQAGLIMFEEGIPEGWFRPFTITQVFADYCRSIHYREPYEMIFSDWEWDYSGSESDEISSGDEAALWELEDAAEFFGINYEAEE